MALAVAQLVTDVSRLKAAHGHLDSTKICTITFALRSCMVFIDVRIFVAHIGAYL